MKLLTSTKLTQGDRDDDFCFVPEGEWLDLPSIRTVCDHPDGSCGCGRALVGIDSRRGTTTALIADVCVSEDALVEAIGLSMLRAGFSGDVDARARCEELILAVMPFDVGAIVERRGIRITERTKARRA